MIINGFDTRNLSVVMDALQAKCLVAVLRRTMASPNVIQLLADAAVDVQEDGFDVLLNDTNAAVASLLSVVGQFTDCVHEGGCQHDHDGQESVSVPDPPVAPKPKLVIH